MLEAALIEGANLLPMWDSMALLLCGAEQAHMHAYHHETATPLHLSRPFVCALTVEPSAFCWLVNRVA